MYHKLDGKAESDVEADNYNCSSDEKESGSEHEEGDCSTCAQCECLSCTMSGPPCQPIDVSKSMFIRIRASILPVLFWFRDSRFS